MADSSSVAAQPPPTPTTPVPGDLWLIRRLWPLLATMFVAGLPFFAASIFIAPIAEDVGSTMPIVGGLRGLGGLAALAAGLLLAPLIDRLPRAWAVAAGLLALAGATVLAITAHLATLVLFYLIVGAATAILMPAVQASSADRLSGPAAGRAATLMMATQGLAIVLAGPLLAVPAMLWGWRGAFLSMAALALVLIGLTSRTLSRTPPENVTRASYLDSFRLVAGAPGAIWLLLSTAFGACLFNGWNAYLAAFFTERFATPTAGVALVFSLAAGCWFVLNLLAGRWINTETPGRWPAWQSAERLLFLSRLLGIATVPLLYLAPSWPLALAGAMLFPASQAAAGAATTSLVVRRYPAIRGAVMGLNMAGINLGAFIGTAAAGVGLAAHSYPGLVVSLLVLAGLSLLATGWAVRNMPAIQVTTEPAPHQSAAD